jgi:hypothetical protein
MAAILQYRRLCNRAKQQLGNLADPVEHAQDSLPCINNGSTTLDDPGGVSAGRNTGSRSEICQATHPYATVPGVSVQCAHDGEIFFQVDWELETDPETPRNWSVRKRVGTTLLLDAVAMVVTVASVIESQ